MTLAELENAKAESLKEIAAANDAAAVEALRVKYVGRNGSIPALIKAMKDVPKEERPAFGKAVQAWRAEVEAALAAKGAGSAGEKAVDADLTLPGRWWGLGVKHPLSRVIEETAAAIFGRLGFTVAGKVLFEVGGVSEEVAKECLRLAATKIGIHTKFITRAGVKI